MNSTIPDWWHRERQRILVRVFIFLVLLLALIGYFYYINSQGRIGYVNGINFDTVNSIAFVRQEKDGSSALFSVQADGTNLTRLTTSADTSTKIQPVWTPDGKSLIYASNLKDGRTMQLYVLGDGKPVQLTYGAGNKFTPSVSPDGKKVVFITQGAVKTVNLNGTIVDQVLPPPSHGHGDEESGGFAEEQGAYLSAGFAPDNLSVAAVKDISGVDLQIGVAQDGKPLAGSQFKLLPVDQMLVVQPNGAEEPFYLDRGHEVSFAWSPDGTKLAASFTELPLMDAKGNFLGADNKPLKTKDAPIFPISGIQIWSFAGNKPTPKAFYLGRGYTIEPKNVSWSPDGMLLAFELWLLKGEGERELAGIRVLEVNEQGQYTDTANPSEIPLTVRVDANGRPMRPRWSPDSRRFLYELQRPDGKRDIYVINANGTNPQNLTNGEGDNFDATWSPLTKK